jgi:hypothetical protein
MFIKSLQKVLDNKEVRVDCYHNVIRNKDLSHLGSKQDLRIIIYYLMRQEEAIDLYDKSETHM